MRLYDTRRRAIVPFEPAQHVSVYVCGITPYDSTHLGHAATYLAFDVLVRHLEDIGHTVDLVRNITDVDDSILPKARELGVDFLELAAEEIARFHSDMSLLGARSPDHEPRATTSIDEMLDLLDGLAVAGHTYTVDGTTYFDVSTVPGYGSLSGYSRERMIELSRERGGAPDDLRQRDPLDFVLWKPSAADEPSWPSRFGPGRPGWHLECSAMAMARIGPTVDLHGGGSDLIYPHHECEVVQSEAVSGVPFARHWMHTGLVAYEGTKMSKSLGNLVFVSDLVKRVDPRSVRLATMRHHYRGAWEWFDGEAEEADATVSAWVELASDRSGHADERSLRAVRDEVRAALDDDLDAPRVATLLDDLARRGSPDELVAAAALVGLDLTEPMQQPAAER